MITPNTIEATRIPGCREQRIVGPLVWESWDYGDESYQARASDSTVYYVVLKRPENRTTAWKHDGVLPTWRRPLQKCLYGGDLSDLDRCKAECERDWANAAGERTFAAPMTL